MLDLRQRTVLWGAWLVGFGAVLLAGVPAALPGPSGTPWVGRRPWAVITWEEARFGTGLLPLETRILEVAGRHGVDPALVAAVVQVESGFRPDAVSPKGAQGLMQVMPETAALLGFPAGVAPDLNLDIGTKYLASLLEQFGGDVELALAAYNAGPGAVRRWGTVPPFRETREFIRRVAGAYCELTGLELRAAARLTSLPHP